MYEQTLRIPFIFEHPRTIRGGRVLDPMLSTLDFFPTLLDYLGLPPYRDPALAGRSFAGFLRGQSPRWENRIFSEYAYVRGIRTERFKYVSKDEGYADEMYDLEADPGEKRNVATDPSYAAERGRLKDEMATWFAKRGAPPISRWRSTVRVRLNSYQYPAHQ
jgi:arylsulfatase A-like enzyme